jgi:phospholipase D1/2
MTSKRLRFKLDSAHPIGAAHHQKIVVIDEVPSRGLLELRVA